MQCDNEDVLLESSTTLTALVTVDTDYLAQRDSQCIVPVNTDTERNVLD